MPKTHVIFPGDSFNAVELSLAIEILIRCGYRVYRTTDSVEIYAPDPETKRGALVVGTQLNEDPINSIRADCGYFSSTWHRTNGVSMVSTNYTWHELTSSVGTFLKLVYEAISDDGWTPPRGWHGWKKSDDVDMCWKMAERLYFREVDVPDWLDVDRSEWGWERKYERGNDEQIATYRRFAGMLRETVDTLENWMDLRRAAHAQGHLTDGDAAYLDSLYNSRIDELTAPADES